MTQVYDWKAIEEDYRGAVLSIAAICRLHGVPRHVLMDKAATGGWVRDLVAQVRREVNERLHSPDVGRTVEEDAISKAAEVMVAVVRSHRKDISKLRDVAAQAMGHFATLMDEGVFIEVEDAEPDEKTGQKPVRLSKSSLVLGKTQGVATALDNLASAYSRIIDMERQAFGLDVKGGPMMDVSVGNDPNAGPKAQVLIYLPDNSRGGPTPE